MSRLLLSLAIAVSAAASAQHGEETAVREVALTRNAQSFLFLGTERCLCNMEGSLTAKDKTLVIEDANACAADMEKLAVAWQNEMDWPITLVSGTPEKMKSAALSLRKRLGDSPEGKLRILSPVGQLHCLVFATPLDPKLPADVLSDRSESEKKVSRSSLLYPDLPEAMPQRDQGLIRDYGTMDPPST